MKSAGTRIVHRFEVWARLVFAISLGPYQGPILWTVESSRMRAMTAFQHSHCLSHSYLEVAQVAGKVEGVAVEQELLAGCREQSYP